MSQGKSQEYCKYSEIKGEILGINCINLYQWPTFSEIEYIIYIIIYNLILYLCWMQMSSFNSIEEAILSMIDKSVNIIGHIKRNIYLQV